MSTTRAAHQCEGRTDRENRERTDIQHMSIINSCWPAIDKPDFPDQGKRAQVFGLQVITTFRPKSLESCGKSFQRFSTGDRSLALNWNPNQMIIIIVMRSWIKRDNKRPTHTVDGFVSICQETSISMARRPQRFYPDRQCIILGSYQQLHR